MKTKQALVGWMKAHPIKAVGFATLFTGLATFAGFLPHTGEVICLGLFLLLLIIFMVVIAHDSKKWVALLVLAIGLQQVTSEEREEPQGLAWCAAAVIVVGGVATYCLAKYCSKKFPKTPAKDTNAPPEEFSFVMAAGADSMAASASSGCDSCYIPGGLSPSLLDTEPVKSLEIIAEVDYQGDLRISSLMETVVPEGREDASLTREEFDAAIAQHGIQLATRYGDYYFGLNGRPASQEQVPIFFDHLPDGSLTIRVGDGEQYEVVLERSIDLSRWYPIMRTSIGAGRKYRFMDLTSELQVFYRLRRN